MREILEKVIRDHYALCYESTVMALELICEVLFYEHGIDARHHGRSIWVNGLRVASIQTCVEPCEDARIVAIWRHWIL